MDTEAIILRAVETALHRLLPTLVAAVAADVQRQIDADLAGTQTYHRKRRDVDDDIAAKFNGRNAQQVAAELGISRRTVYRSIKRRLEKSRQR